MKIQTLETERLILRPFKIGDGEFMYKNWASDPSVTKFLRYAPHASIEFSNEAVKMFIERNKSGKELLWCMVLKESGEPIGSIGMSTLSERDNVSEMGYNLGRAFWNRGLMTEAVKKVFEFAFTQTTYNRIEASHAIGNPSSGKVMQKAGMTFEGNSRQKYFATQLGYQDTANYAILREDLIKKK